MKTDLNQRAKSFFIHMGRRSRYLRVPAVAGLSVCLFVHHFCRYWGRKTRKLACTAFLVVCFVTGSSFAYPGYQVEGAVPGGGRAAMIRIAAQEVIAGGTARLVEFENPAVPRTGEISEGYGYSESYDTEQTDQYFLGEILEQGQRIRRSVVSSEVRKLTAGKEPVFDAQDWKLVLINKQHPIPEDYTFTLDTIKTVQGNMQCDERIVEELHSMMQSADEEGVHLAICSPYRDLNRQETLFNRKIRSYMNKGMSYMEAYKISSQVVTVPGASEHQIGLAIDIVSDTYTVLDEGFADTEAGIWLKEHCAEYGFILRYPEGKEYITSIKFEPWHFRYVGRDAAELIMENELCLEEFWDKYVTES